jgi:hypothetical protein
VAEMGKDRFSEVEIGRIMKDEFFIISSGNVDRNSSENLIPEKIIKKLF